jgi:hypothetical protein
MLVPYREYVSLVRASMLIMLILTIAVKQYMDIGDRPHVCGRRASRAWETGLTCMGDRPHVHGRQASRAWATGLTCMGVSFNVFMFGLTPAVLLSIGPYWAGSSLQNVVLNKNRMMDNVQKHNNCSFQVHMERRPVSDATQCGSHNNTLEYQHISVLTIYRKINQFHWTTFLVVFTKYPAELNIIT